MLRGLYDEASERFDLSQELAPDDFSKADILTRIAELRFKQAEPAGPIGLYEEAMRVGGFPTPPRNRVICAMQVLKFAAVQFLHSYLPSLFPRRRCDLPDDNESVRLRCLHGVTLPYMFIDGPLHGLWAHLQDLNRSECYPGSREVAQAYARHVFLMNVMGRRFRVKTYAERSLRIRRELGHRWGVGQTLTYLSATQMLESDLEGAVESLTEAIRIFTETGDWFEHNMAGALLAMALFRQDRLKEAAAQAERVYRSGVEIGDYQVAGIVLGPWALATEGQIPPVVLEAELSRPREDGDRFASTMVHGARGLCHLYAGELESVRKYMNHAEELGGMGPDTMMTAPIYVWRLEVLCAVAASHPEGSRERIDCLRQARKCWKHARKLASRFPFIEAEACRRASELKLLTGSRTDAIHLLEVGLAVTERSGDLYERRMTLARLNELNSAASGDSYS